MSARVFVRRRGLAGFVAGVCTASLVSSGIALAAIPSTATGSVTACVNRTSGTVRDQLQNL